MAFTAKDLVAVLRKELGKWEGHLPSELRAIGAALDLYDKQEVDLTDPNLASLTTYVNGVTAEPGGTYEEQKGVEEAPDLPEREASVAAATEDDEKK